MFVAAVYRWLKVAPPIKNSFHLRESSRRRNTYRRQLEFLSPSSPSIFSCCLALTFAVVTQSPLCRYRLRHRHRHPTATLPPAWLPAYKPACLPSRPQAFQTACPPARLHAHKFDKKFGVDLNVFLVSCYSHRHFLSSSALAQFCFLSFLSN